MAEDRVRSFEVRPEDIDQLLGRRDVLGVGLLLGIEHVLADVAFQDLDDQAVHRAARGRDQLQHVGTILLPVQGALHGFDLTPDAPDPPDQLLSVVQGV